MLFECSRPEMPNTAAQKVSAMILEQVSRAGAPAGLGNIFVVVFAVDSSFLEVMVDVIAVSTVIRMCGRMWYVPWPPWIDGAKGRVRNAVEVGCGMRNGVHMVPMWNVVRMRRCMRNVVVMRLWIEALCACKLSHSKNCDGGDYDGARFQHFISP